MADTFTKDDKSESEKETAQTFEKKEETSDDSQPFLAVGDRKFADSSAVVDKIVHADAHISSLEGENKALREALDLLKKDADKSATVEELLEGLKSNTSTEGGSGDQAVDPDVIVSQVMDKVTATLSEQQTAQQQAANFNKAADMAREVLGEEFLDKIASKAASLGVALDDIDTIAKKSPDAFAKLILGEVKTKTNTTNRGTVRTQASQGAAQETQSRRFMRMSTKERAAAIASRLEELT